jgi:glyoxylase-like metal-dependent hydrolase (beta-lactamase superfamily II)
MIHRTTLVETNCDGEDYLVALAGESEWVRNVRAAEGRVVIGRRERRAAKLVEVPPEQRAPVIGAYLLRQGRRADSKTAAKEARYYFGVNPNPSLDEIEQIVQHYPVFKIVRESRRLVGLTSSDAVSNASARSQRPVRGKPTEIASGVFWLPTGSLTLVPVLPALATNVYLVQAGSSWTLIDTGWPHRGQLIRSAAETLFGEGTRPEAIVLTHVHLDHSGSAIELAKLWNVPVYVPPGDLPLTSAAYPPEYLDPIGRLIEPAMRILPKSAESALARVTQGFGPSAAPPGLPDWECIPTPGHSPGHSAFFRRHDGILITGDAVLTLNFNSLWDLMLLKHGVSGAPHISTWNWPMAKESVATLARLEPKVLAPGHGRPISGDGTSTALRLFSERFSS